MIQQEIRDKLQEYLECANKRGIEGYDFEIDPNELEILLLAFIADIEKILQKRQKGK